MKRIYPKLLKKLTIQDIKKMRELYRVGYSRKRLAHMFGIVETAVDWHCMDIGHCEHIEVT